jgi:hypothetical protein
MSSSTTPFLLPLQHIIIPSTPTQLNSTQLNSTQLINRPSMSSNQTLEEMFLTLSSDNQKTFLEKMKHLDSGGTPESSDSIKPSTIGSSTVGSSTFRPSTPENFGKLEREKRELSSPFTPHRGQSRKVFDLSLMNLTLDPCQGTCY